jgi:hypothetical protein
MKAVYSRAGPKFVYMFKTLLGHCKDLNYLIKVTLRMDCSLRSVIFLVFLSTIFSTQKKSGIFNKYQLLFATPATEKRVLSIGFCQPGQIVQKKLFSVAQQSK